MMKTARAIALDRIRQAQEVANKAVKASHDLQRAAPQFRKGWDAAWVNQLNANLRMAKEQGDDPIALFKVATLPGALSTWWTQSDGGRIVVSDTKYRYTCYNVKHPKAKLSDEMSVRRAEFGFGTVIRLSGGLSTVESMGEVSSSLIRLADDYFRHNDRTSGVCQSVEEFIKRALPVILTYTRYLGARVAA